MPLVAILIVAIVFGEWSGAESPAPVSGKSCATAECHGKFRENPFIHRPLKADGCTVCHRLGTGTKTFEKNGAVAKNHPQMIETTKEKVTAACLVCHDNFTGAGFAVVHKPIKEKGCVECHDPHGAKIKSLLRAGGVRENCLSCHKEMKDKDLGAHTHVLDDGKTCLTCHDSHFSHSKKMLRQVAAGTCLQCHNEPQHHVRNVGKELKNAKSTHKPAREGKCQDCHDPHGSVAEGFLKKSLAAPGYSLCMECHKPEMLLESGSGERTKFRNGSTNLHYLHLQTKHIKVQGCSACHETHGSEQERLVRRQMPFGEWKVPIEFTATANGGTCATACHREKKYDRVQKIENEAGR